MLFYYSAVAFPITMLLVYGESWIFASAVRLYSYDLDQYLWIIALSTINFVGLNASTIAL